MFQLDMRYIIIPLFYSQFYHQDEFNNKYVKFSKMRRVYLLKYRLIEVHKTVWIEHETFWSIVSVLELGRGLNKHFLQAPEFEGR